ncbi:hypothetical protein Sme01_03050 [Sphaerisporangium melleum]|uniref:Uncharacterized protein n=1 Tax=Sphaerisporangium melleum TaxID=321316 RepID=A0A917QP47_9ACTN|nr:hypothetical protein [Sphaerisporangium melleum]GGK61346.1 hypothetical protein GCM10007964_00590 [Sphaerisporangium melleum]GII67829.1 hypothetical protein Sme01_03050 [Sphaerisporangium melleum]
MLEQVKAALRRTRRTENASAAQRIAAMERQADADRLGDDERLARAIAAAECAAHGHVGPIPVEPEVDAANDYAPWGLVSPFRRTPSCQRCGVELPEAPDV